MGSSTTKKPLAVTTLRIEREKLDFLARVAKANQRSVNQEMRWLIDRHVADFREKEAA